MFFIAQPSKHALLFLYLLIMMNEHVQCQVEIPLSCDILLGYMKEHFDPQQEEFLSSFPGGTTNTLFWYTNILIERRCLVLASEDIREIEKNNSMIEMIGSIYKNVVLSDFENESWSNIISSELFSRRSLRPFPLPEVYGIKITVHKKIYSPVSVDKLWDYRIQFQDEVSGISQNHLIMVTIEFHSNLDGKTVNFIPSDRWDQEWMEDICSHIPGGC